MGTMTCFCRLSGDERDLFIWGGGVYGGELKWTGVLQEGSKTLLNIFLTLKSKVFRESGARYT